jgi:cell wall-associated NlpC family hydrolase
VARDAERRTVVRARFDFASQKHGNCLSRLVFRRIVRLTVRQGLPILRPMLHLMRLPRPAAVAVALGCALAAGAACAAPDPGPTTDSPGRLLAGSGMSATTAPAKVAAPAVELVQRVGDRASEMVFTAMGFLGVPYKRGGSTDTAGFDCSGFTRHIFELTLGRVLPRRADEQAKAPGLVPVAKDELRPGDLVFFNTLKRTFSHVGIYVGEGRFIHAPRPGGEVRVEQMGLAYWRHRFTGARRVDGLAAPAAVSASGPASDPASAPGIVPAP